MRQFLADADAITKEFVSQLHETGSGSPVPDVLPELSKLNLERE